MRPQPPVDPGQGRGQCHKVDRQRHVFGNARRCERREQEWPQDAGRGGGEFSRIEAIVALTDLAGEAQGDVGIVERVGNAERRDDGLDDQQQRRQRRKKKAYIGGRLSAPRIPSRSGPADMLL